MSGKSGQLLTSTFYDDCENIVLHNGYPVFVVNKNEFFNGDVVNVTFSSFEEASKRLGLSVDVLKDLTRLASVKLLSKFSSEAYDALTILPLRACGLYQPKSTLDSITSHAEFGDVSNGSFLLQIIYDINGEFIAGYFTYTLE